MTTYTVQSPDHHGGALTMSAPGGTSGDLAPTGTGIGLLCQTAGTAITVTLPFTPTYDGQTVTSRTVVTPATGLTLIPLPTTVYGAGTTPVNYSATTNLTVAVIQVAT